MLVSFQATIQFITILDNLVVCTLMPFHWLLQRCYRGVLRAYRLVLCINCKLKATNHSLRLRYPILKFCVSIGKLALGVIVLLSIWKTNLHTVGFCLARQNSISGMGIQRPSELPHIHGWIFYLDEGESMAHQLLVRCRLPDHVWCYTSKHLHIRSCISYLNLRTIAFDHIRPTHQMSVGRIVLSESCPYEQRLFQRCFC